MQRTRAYALINAAIGVAALYRLVLATSPANDFAPWQILVCSFTATIFTINAWWLYRWGKSARMFDPWR